jgi:hypothetical protein
MIIPSIADLVHRLDTLEQYLPTTRDDDDDHSQNHEAWPAAQSLTQRRMVPMAAARS